jgi:hypothetical protein
VRPPTTRRRARPHRRNVSRDGLGGHRRLALGAAVVASIGLTAVGVAGATRQQPAPTEAERQVRREIAAMIDSGVPADDPKVEMLEAQADELRRSTRANPPEEPGVDLGRRVADAKAAERAADRARDRAVRTRAGSAAAAGIAGQATTGGVLAGPAWQSGTVECEPLPQILTAREVAGATCLGVPQPDGSTRYVAVGRDGVVRTVAFAPDGQVRRGPDRRMPGGATPGATLAPTDAGDIRVTVGGRAPVTVDVG